MEKLTKEQLAKFWRNWECDVGESFIDYFIDDNINNIGLILGYWAAKYPDLFEYIIKYTDGCIVWNYVQDTCNKYDVSLDELVENFYGVYEEQDLWIEENYNNSIVPWCDLICGIDVYYKRFIKWCSDNGITSEKFINKYL